MKARINLILCLLLIAITISLIAVSFGWYAAEAGKITVEDSSVTITTADNDFYVGGANFEFVKTMSRTSDTTFKVHDEKQPYYGECGIFDEEYIILVRMDKNASDNQGNPLSNDGYPYIKSIHLSSDNDTIDYSYNDTSQYESDFRLFYVSYDGSEAEIIERDKDVTPEYIAIIFGNGNSIFKYSGNQYLGYNYTIKMDYYNQ